MLKIQQAVTSRRSKMEYCIYPRAKIDRCDYHLSLFPLLALLHLKSGNNKIWWTTIITINKFWITMLYSTVTGNPHQPRVILSSIVKSACLQSCWHIVWRRIPLSMSCLWNLEMRTQWECDISTTIRHGKDPRFGKFVTIGQHLI